MAVRVEVTNNGKCVEMVIHNGSADTITDMELNLEGKPYNQRVARYDPDPPLSDLAGGDEMQMVLWCEYDMPTSGEFSYKDSQRQAHTISVSIPEPPDKH